jgi:PleD family two-component response regulator
LNEIGILILDDNAESCQALHHLLDSEGWRVHFASEPRAALSALASGAWSLAIANVELAAPGSQLFTILGDLAHAEGVTVTPDPLALAPHAKKASARMPQKKRLRVLFVVPSNVATEAVPILEHEELPYSIRPYHMRDFFDKISDLLVDAGAIADSRDARFELAGRESGLRKPGRESKLPSMFASRSDYQMTEEEITEYERQEEEQRRKKSKKEPERNIW